MNLKSEVHQNISNFKKKMTFKEIKKSNQIKSTIFT